MYLQKKFKQDTKNSSGVKRMKAKDNNEGIQSES